MLTVFRSGSALIEGLGAFQILVEIDTVNHDHHELTCTDLINARERLDEFLKLNHISLSKFEESPTLREQNLQRGEAKSCRRKAGSPGHGLAASYCLRRTTKVSA